MSLLVVGSANTDMVVKTEKMPLPGETVLGGEFSMHFGGKGANQAVCAQKLGMKTGFYTRLGEDVFGHNTLDYLNGLGIDTSRTELMRGVSSGVALITVDSTGENSIVVAGGANKGVLPLEIEYSRDYINSFDGLLVQFEIPMKSVITAVELAHNMGKFVAVNPAPANVLPERYFPMIDVLIPNRGEARQLLGMAPDDETLQTEDLARKLREKGVKNVVITLGSQGSYISSKEGDFYINSYPVNAVDTTGAGDAYCAAFVCACLWGKSMREAGEFASKVSALKVTKMGTQNTPTREEAEKFQG
ncbi:MAG: ribokinase [Armatimonadetes bacterium]|nr:ribokinase [Candidatus Hippobium faecium]